LGHAVLESLSNSFFRIKYRDPNAEECDVRLAKPEGPAYAAQEKLQAMQRAAISDPGNLAQALIVQNLHYLSVVPPPFGAGMPPQQPMEP
jgi:hypothetical protein